MSRAVLGALFFGGIAAVAVIGLRVNQSGEDSATKPQQTAIRRSESTTVEKPTDVTHFRKSPECTVSDVKITSVRGGFKDTCRRTPCFTFRGVAVLTNECSMPLGVQIKITGYDADGAPLATSDWWPASTNKIAPGEYTFSIDHWLDYDSSIRKFALQPIAISQ